MVEKLKKLEKINTRRGPLVLCIMDGVAFGPHQEGDGVKAARMPTLTSLWKSCPSVLLKAHGRAVGMPSDGDMGNSEVGHNAMGCGRVFDQGAQLVNRSIEKKELFSRPTWCKLVKNCLTNGSTLHFLGLISDGNVHSHIDHLRALVLQAKKEGIGRVCVHGLLDGRDVGATSALEYFEPLESFFEEISNESFRVAFGSGGGRMFITMDRYEADWSMVERGWRVHVLAEGEAFRSASEAISTLRQRSGVIDQDLPPFVIEDAGGKRFPVEDGDSFVFFNFRGDRAIEMSRAFEEGPSFDKFDRKRVPRVEYAGMMEYDGDLHIPRQYLVDPPAIDRTMPEYLCSMGIRQYSISETQKYGHVTYFFNGNRSGKFSQEYETYVEIPSDKIPFDQKPAMKSLEITEKVLETIKTGEYRFLKLNYPNGDMVGHTGNFSAVVASLQALDECLGQLVEAIKAAQGILIVTADHGNSDDMYERDKKGQIICQEDGSPKPKTSHSLHPVPFILFDPGYQSDYGPHLRENLGISSIAATCLNLLGYKAPDFYDPSLLFFPES